MTTVKKQRQQRQQRQQRRQRQMNKGGFLKNLHLKWWVWIIIIIIGVNIIGSVLAPIFSALGTFEKAMQNILGVPEQIASFANDHPWMYYVGFFAVMGSQLGLFGAAKTYIGRKMFREKAEGKSTEQTLSKTKEAVKKNIDELEKKNQELDDKGETPLTPKQIADKSAEKVTIDELRNDNQALREKVDALKKDQAKQAEVIKDLEAQLENIDKSENLPKDDKEEAKDDVENMLKDATGGAEGV